MISEEQAGLPPKDMIKYWTDLIQADLGAFSDIDRVLQIMYHLADNKLLKYFVIKIGDIDTGVFAYMVTDDFLGGKCLSELMFYIKPEYRGDLKLVKEYIQRAEAIGKETKCECVKIGANIEYKDSSLIKLLRRWGYVDDTVSKKL